jgi:hypothetical protein
MKYNLTDKVSQSMRELIYGIVLERSAFKEAPPASSLIFNHSTEST